MNLQKGPLLVPSSVIPQMLDLESKVKKQIKVIKSIRSLQNSEYL